MNRLLQKTTTNVSNFGRLSSGVTKQQRQINKQLEASERAQRQQKISNFGKLASQTKKSTEVRKNKKMEEALKNIIKLVR